MLLRRALSLVICFAMLATALWLVRPSLWGVDAWPSGFSVLLAAGLGGPAIGWLWTEFVERSDD